MIKLGNTDHKGHSRSEIATLKEKVDILEDNGEPKAQKGFWSKKDLKT